MLGLHGGQSAGYNSSIWTTGHAHPKLQCASVHVHRQSFYLQTVMYVNVFFSHSSMHHGVDTVKSWSLFGMRLALS